MLEWRHVEIADEDRALGLFRPQAGMGAHFIKEAKLVVEFRIDVGIGFVAAGGDVKIMQSDLIVQSGAFAQHDRDMPAVDLPQKFCTSIRSNGTRESTATP